MQTIACPNCAASFEFDSKQIWNSPIPLLDGSLDQKLVIQCPKCKNWMAFEAKELKPRPK
jgi:phage FluMu protein Com